MQFASALSTAPDLADAIAEVVNTLHSALGAAPVDLCTVFVHPSYGDLRRLPAELGGGLDARHLIGCTGGGVLAADREIEGHPALAVAAGRMPGVTIEIRHSSSHLPDADGPPAAWVELCGGLPDQTAGVLVLADPFTMDIDALLGGLDFAYPSAPKIGGLASGGSAPGSHTLFADAATHHSGAVTAVLGGALQITPVVAQGCRPIGGVGAITACDGHHLRRIDDRSAASWLQDQIVHLQARDRALLESTPVFLGLSMNPFQVGDPAPGNFLIRNLLGLDRSSGSMGVGAELSVGRKVQLHLRDGDSSAADLRRALASARGPQRPAFALLFSCLGRGAALYGKPDHDTGAFRDLMGSTPLSGFFCNGEIGPVGATSFVHGYTAALALFEEAAE